MFGPPQNLPRPYKIIHITPKPYLSHIGKVGAEGPGSPIRNKRGLKHYFPIKGVYAPSCKRQCFKLVGLGTPWAPPIKICFLRLCEMTFGGSGALVNKRAASASLQTPCVSGVVQTYHTLSCTATRAASNLRYQY